MFSGCEPEGPVPEFVDVEVDRLELQWYAFPAPLAMIVVDGRIRNTSPYRIFRWEADIEVDIQEPGELVAEGDTALFQGTILRMDELPEGTSSVFEGLPFQSPGMDSTRYPSPPEGYSIVSWRLLSATGRTKPPSVTFSSEVD